MKTKINNDQLLLYWSGELDPEEAKRIENQLATDPEALAYLEELQDLRKDFETLPKITPTKVAASAVAEFSEPAKPRRVVMPWLAAAAAVVIVGFFVTRGLENPESKAIVESPKEESVTTQEEIVETPKRTLSKSLFASQTRFSTSERYQSPSRERLRRIRDSRESTSS
ncbi:MAG: hypothetical protein AAGA58_11565 [Verrucomicrobiota bacterium]